MAKLQNDQNELPLGSTTAELGVPNIFATANDVYVCGSRVPRPPGIAPSQWLKFWKGVAS